MEALESAGIPRRLFEASSDGPPIARSAEALQVAIGGMGGQARALLAGVLDYRPTVVHAHNLLPLLGAGLLERLLDAGIPCIVSLHNYRVCCAAGTLVCDGQPCERCIDGSSFNAVRRGCYRGSAASTSVLQQSMSRLRALLTDGSPRMRVVAPTEWASRELVRLCPSLGEVGVLPNIVATCDGRPRSVVDPPKVLMVSRLSEEKGIDVILEALALAEAPRARLRVAGDGPERRALENRALHLGIECDFLGQLTADELANEYAAAAACVCPSLAPETFGLAAAEACSCGLPVAVSDVGALSEVVGAPLDAWAVAEHTPHAWAGAIEEMLGDAAEAADRADRARARVRAVYSAQRFVDSLVTLAASMDAD